MNEEEGALPTLAAGITDKHGGRARTWQDAPVQGLREATCSLAGGAEFIAVSSSLEDLSPGDQGLSGCQAPRGEMRCDGQSLVWHLVAS